MSEHRCVYTASDYDALRMEAVGMERRIGNLETEIERLRLRCRRADECIVDFENATGGFPAAKRMQQRIEDLEAEVEARNRRVGAQETEIMRLREACIRALDSIEMVRLCFTDSPIIACGTFEEMVSRVEKFLRRALKPTPVAEEG